MLASEIIDRVIQSVGDSGETGDVMKALGYSQTDFEKGFAIANTIQNLDLIKLLYSNFNENRIIVEFTLLGRKHYKSISQGR